MSDPSPQVKVVRYLLKAVLVLLAVILGIALLIEAVAFGTWALSNAGEFDATKIATMQVPNRRPTRSGLQNTYLTVWPRERGRHFGEAPALAEQVAAGKLPPVAERLPEDPMVVIPFEVSGVYGGTWPMYGMDPNDINTFITSRLPYDGLLRWTPMGDKVVPNLAWKYEVSPDNRIYTLWLRKGVKWSDGVPFTADDVEFWYKDVFNNRTLTPTKTREFMQGSDTVAFEKLDDYTIRFTWKKPNSMFLMDLAMMAGYLPVEYPAHYIKQFHEAYVPRERMAELLKQYNFDTWNRLFADRMNCQNVELPRLWAWTVTEPFPAHPIRLSRNPYYWKVDQDGNQLPYIDTVTFDVFEQEIINMKAINGEIGMQGRHLRLSNYPIFMQQSQKGNYHINYWISSNGGTNVLGVNMNHPDPAKRAVFQDDRFRKALSLALNRQEINEICYYGLGTPRQVSPPSTSPYFDADYASAYTAYDPAQANGLLDAMGLTQRNEDGVRLLPDGQPLSLLVESVAMASDLDVLQLVAEYWRAVGIAAEVRAEARPLFYQRKDGALHDVSVWYGADEAQPMLDPRWLLPFTKESLFGVKYAIWFRTGGAGGVEPPADMKRANALFEQSKTTENQEERVALFKQIMDINKEHLWTIGTIGELPEIFLVRNTFRNVPEVAVSGYSFRTPGNTAPECYAIVEGR